MGNARKYRMVHCRGVDCERRQNGKDGEDMNAYMVETTSHAVGSVVIIADSVRLAIDAFNDANKVGADIGSINKICDNVVVQGKGIV
jgi:hypothetical protein